MKFEKIHRREPTEPQLATMIDVFSILIIFLIAGVTMESSVLSIPADLFLPETTSEATSVNAPQVTIENDVVSLNFIKESLSIQELEQDLVNSKKIKRIEQKIKSYLQKVDEDKKKKLKDSQWLKSINLVADRDTSYKKLFVVLKFLRNLGFLNTILVGVEGNGKK